MNLSILQVQLKEWQKHNFPGRPSYQPLLGVVEEVGELSHAHLKLEQKIRGSEKELTEKSKDAVGDIIIFLADYCNSRNFVLEEIIEDTWTEVRKRDWDKYRKENNEGWL